MISLPAGTHVWLAAGVTDIRDVLWLPPVGDAKTRQTVLVGALALAVFWDPAQLY